MSGALDRKDLEPKLVALIASLRVPHVQQAMALLLDYIDAGRLTGAAEAVQAERDRVYGLFLSTPWEVDPVTEEDNQHTTYIKADRFNLMALVRDGVAGSPPNG